MDTQAASRLIGSFAQLKARLRAERLGRMREVVSAFASVRARAHPPLRVPPLAERLATMAEMIEAYALLSERLRRTRPAEFSILRVLRRQDDEVTHSRLLAWLLDSRADHGQRALFVSALASLIGLEADPESLGRCSVRTEFYGPEAIVDVAVFRAGDFLVFIENNIWAAEGEGQVDREFRDLQHTGRALQVPPDRQSAVFLTRRGGQPITGDPSPWICVSYRQLAERFRPLVPKISDDKVRMVVEDWLSVISDWG